MKLLALTSLLLIAAQAANAADSVSVLIDGQTYSCSQGGSSPGNMCECALNDSTAPYYWIIYKKGQFIISGKYTSDPKDEVLERCRRNTLKMPDCYN